MRRLPAITQEVTPPDNPDDMGEVVHAEPIAPPEIPDAIPTPRLRTQKMHIRHAT